MAKDGLRFLGLDYSCHVSCICDILDKHKSQYEYVSYMLVRTNSMFRYHNLPDTIPANMLEYMLQVYGEVAIISYDGNLYAIQCSFGGPPDPYFRPTQAVIANPALGLTGTWRISNNLPPFDKSTWEKYPECVQFRSDNRAMGLIPMYSRYAAQLAENDISIRSSQINLRSQTVIVADNGPEAESAQAYIDNLEKGHLANIVKRPFMEGIRVENQNSGGSNSILQLIQLHQYLKANWYNDIGLNSNGNIKSQYQSERELNATVDIMLPLIDDMLKCREQALKEVNRVFGTNISVEKNSAWEVEEKATEALMEAYDALEDEDDVNVDQAKMDRSTLDNNESEHDSAVNSTLEYPLETSVKVEIAEAFEEVANILVEEENSEEVNLEDSIEEENSEEVNDEDESSDND